MDYLAKILLCIALGAGLLFLDTVFFSGIYKSFRSRTIEIAPFDIVGRDDKDGALGNELASMLQARFDTLQRELARAQTSISQANARQSPTLVAAAQSDQLQPPRLADQPDQAQVPSFFKGPTQIPTALLNNIPGNLSVAGVELPGVFAWLQRLALHNQLLRFSVYFESNRAVVTGDLSALGSRDHLWIDATDAAPDAIVKRISYELIRVGQHLSDASTINANHALQDSKIDTLREDEFRDFVDAIINTAELNRQLSLGRPDSDGYREQFEKMEALSKALPGWNKLYYFTASLAASAGNVQAAQFYYQLASQGENDTAQLAREKIGALKTLSNVSPLLSSQTTPLDFDVLVRKLALLTGSFETSSLEPADIFGSVVGDFDGQGLSLGVLQWNFGQCSLQPLLEVASQI